MSEYLLELNAVTAGYAKDIDVLRDVSLHVKAGEISGLIGLNGAGKSTLVKTICGFLHPKDGEILYEKKSINFLLYNLLIVVEGNSCPQPGKLLLYYDITRDP